MWKDVRNNLKLFQHKKFVVRERSKEKKDELEEYFKIENEYGDENWSERRCADGV